MFTGIIDAVGRARGFKGTKGKGGVLEVEWRRGPVRRLKAGASLAVDGVCLTLIRRRGSRLFFNVVEETRKRTTLAGLMAGQGVNLERPLKAGSRVEGHFVLGHVDGVGRIEKIVGAKKDKSLFVRFPKPLAPYLVRKGSVAVNGVSMTLGKLGKKGFWIHCIPHTLRKTNLGALEAGSRVNLEADILAKLLKSVVIP